MRQPEKNYPEQTDRTTETLGQKAIAALLLTMRALTSRGTSNALAKLQAQQEGKEPQNPVEPGIRKTDGHNSPLRPVRAERGR